MKNLGIHSCNGELILLVSGDTKLCERLYKLITNCRGSDPQFTGTKPNIFTTPVLKWKHTYSFNIKNKQLSSKYICILTQIYFCIPKIFKTNV